jgi:hypothetical protein
MSDSYYEDILIPSEGIAVKMGVSNSFEDNFYYENHVYDITKANPLIEERNDGKIIVVHSLYKRVSRPDPDRYLDLYGTIVVDIDDLSAVIKAIREVANNIKREVFHKQYVIEAGNKLDHKLSHYGGDVIYCKPRSFRNKGQPDPDPLVMHETALHVHEWRDYPSGDYDILITELAKTGIHQDYESHDYDSIFIRINHEEKFIAALEQMKVRLENCLSISEDS